MTNEIVKANNNQEVQQLSQRPVRRDENGKYKGVAVYNQVLPTTPEIIADEVKLFNIMAGNGENVIPFKDIVGCQITLVDIMTVPYNKVDEDTGYSKQGVVTTIFGLNGEIYTTSSANVYFTIENALKMFGYPGTESFKPLTFEVFQEVVGNSRNKSMCLRLVKRG